MRIKVIIGIAVLLIAGLFTSAYTVDETDQVVVTQFGRAIGRPKVEPGLYLKVPAIQRANHFPKNLLEWSGDPEPIPTLDKTFITVEAFARWKIVDPLLFFQTLNTVDVALSRLEDILSSSIRNLITSHPLIETVRMTNRELGTLDAGEDDLDGGGQSMEISDGREKIVEGIISQARPKLLQFGIALVDLNLKRLSYVEDVQNSVFQRMISERKRIAEKLRSEGAGEARKIEGDMEKDVKEISSEAYRRAAEIKGKADAESTRIYAQAFNRDPDFYSFYKSLDVYREVMDKKSSLILSTDSDFLELLKGLEGRSEEGGR